MGADMLLHLCREKKEIAMLRRVEIIVSKVWMWLLCIVATVLIYSCGSSKSASRSGNVEEMDDKQLEQEVDRLKKIISRQNIMVIYGPPEMMERVARENDSIATRVEEMEAEIYRRRESRGGE